MSETSTEHHNLAVRTINRQEVLLDMLGWTVVTPQAQVRPHDRQRLIEVDNLAPELRLIATAYYALELSNPMLKPLAETAAGLDQINEPGHPGNDKILDDFIVATTVYELLSEAQATSDPHKHTQSLIELTSDFTLANTGCLYALSIMREVPPVRKLGAETLLRILIDKEQKRRSS